MHPPTFLLRAVVAAAALVLPLGAQLPEAVLTPAEPGSSYGFGDAVDLDLGRALVGAPYADDSTGAAHVLELQAGQWVEVAELRAADGAPHDAFGGAVALDGDRALVGAQFHDGWIANSGAAYVFELREGAWVQAADLDAAALVGFLGVGVALEGDRALVGSYQGAFVFELQGGTWVRTAELQPSSAPPDALFGAAVALSGDRALVGAPRESAAYVFELMDGAWIETAKLLPSGFTFYFGGSVALEGDRALIGDVQEMDLGSGLGTARVFDLVGDAWVEGAILAPSDPEVFKSFAASVALTGGRALVGAPGDDEGAYLAGSAYLFEPSDTGWAQVAKLTSPSPEEYGSFGAAVALLGDKALVGAHFEGGGVAHLFDVGDAAAPLQAGPDRISLSHGGVQTYALNAGPALGGLVHWLLGSTGGTAPGVPLGRELVLPLNPDAYLGFTLAHPGQPPLVDALGLLGTAGHAYAALVIPPGTHPALAGLTVHHAYVVLDPATLAVAATSPPVAVRLVP